MAFRVSYHSRGFSREPRVVRFAWIVQMWYSKSSIGCPRVLSLVSCNATQALSWKFLFPHKILRGTMRGDACKCEVINERYCNKNSWKKGPGLLRKGYGWQSF